MHYAARVDASNIIILKPQNSKHIRTQTQQWLEDVVITLGFCPFAKQELVNDRIRFSVTDAQDEGDLLQALETECRYLQDHPETATALLIHPHALAEFDDYNQFLLLADNLLVMLKLDGIFQIASFHPDYRFADTTKDAAENYTNRSPYPMLHLLRENDVEQAIVHYPDVDEIPQRNITKTRKLGAAVMQQLLDHCITENHVETG